jgi:hypothetical protein
MQRGLQECWRSAQRWLTSISTGTGSAVPWQVALQECWRSAHRWLTSISATAPLRFEATHIHVSRITTLELPRFIFELCAEWLAGGVLAQCRALVHLDLRENYLFAAGAESLAGVLGQCAALAHLNLHDNYIGDAGAKSLAGVLPQCTALAHLDLSLNQIGDANTGHNGIAGAEILAGVLGQCAALAHLNLSYNDFETDGAERLLASWHGQASGLLL